MKLPYTIIDIGWWYQIATPRLSSGKIDYAMNMANDELIVDGKTPSAITDLRDIGKYVAKIIADPRTENKMVFAYNEVMSPADIWDTVERLSGEKLERKFVRVTSLFFFYVVETAFIQYTAQLMTEMLTMKQISEETVMERVKEGRASSETYPFDATKFTPRIAAEYQLSWGIRGDNVPEYAKYLGYLDARELYPDFKPISFEEYITELLSGKGTGVYTDRISRIY